MNIVIVGAGYVGLVSGACFSEFGFNVLCIDKDKNKIKNLNMGKIPIYEPGLDEIIKKNALSKRLKFSSKFPEKFINIDAVFITVGTPAIADEDKVDLSQVFEAVKDIVERINLKEKPILIVTKSTVPIGTGRKIIGFIKEYRPELDIEKHFDVASNPEFLREGSAIEDFMRPDRVICGVETNFSMLMLKELYRPLNLRETPLLFSNLETAELIKYASNSFLATKITFINEMADICEKVGADVQLLAKGIGLDKRIGPKFLHPGPGYGGSCFPKDTKALVDIAKKLKTRTKIVESVVLANEERKLKMVKKIERSLGGLNKKNIAVLGITFKPNTDDLRDSPSLIIVPELKKLCKNLKIYDPAGMENAKQMKQFKDVIWCTNTFDCIDGADAMVIITEWNEFRALDLSKVKSLLNNPLVIDLRNIYREDLMQEYGIEYLSVGRGKINL